MSKGNSKAPERALTDKKPAPKPKKEPIYWAAVKNITTGEFRVVRTRELDEEDSITLKGKVFFKCVKLEPSTDVQGLRKYAEMRNGKYQMN